MPLTTLTKSYAKAKPTALLMRVQYLKLLRMDKLAGYTASTKYFVCFSKQKYAASKNDPATYTGWSIAPFVATNNGE